MSMLSHSSKKTLTADDAWNILRSKDPFIRCRGCLDFGDFYLFSTAPMAVKNDDMYMSGTVFDAVSKTNGKCFLYDITSDLDAYENAKPIKVKTIYDTIVRR